MIRENNNRVTSKLLAKDDAQHRVSRLKQKLILGVFSMMLVAIVAATAVSVLTFKNNMAKQQAAINTDEPTSLILEEPQHTELNSGIEDDESVPEAPRRKPLEGQEDSNTERLVAKVVPQQMRELLNNIDQDTGEIRRPRTLNSTNIRPTATMVADRASRWHSTPGGSISEREQVIYRDIIATGDEANTFSLQTARGIDELACASTGEAYADMVSRRATARAGYGNAWSPTPYDLELESITQARMDMILNGLINNDPSHMRTFTLLSEGAQIALTKLLPERAIWTAIAPGSGVLTEFATDVAIAHAHGIGSPSISSIWPMKASLYAPLTLQESRAIESLTYDLTPFLDLTLDSIAQLSENEMQALLDAIPVMNPDPIRLNYTLSINTLLSKLRMAIITMNTHIFIGASVTGIARPEIQGP